jgi:hypothetical protein
VAAHNAAIAAAHDAIADGARLVDLGVTDEEAVRAVRAIDPTVIVCAEAPGADLTRDPEVAAHTGAVLLRPAPTNGSPGSGGGTSGSESILVTSEPADVGRLAPLGWAVVVDVDAVDFPGTLAVAAICAWLGARILRTRHVAAVRQAVEMVESIRGARAPSWARRGLA